ncbi:futalosine hydrolase [Paenibacillus campi]|uniref:futalosine hydrolase n=1 Tax=Paenibacillus campi TaxID=3106031 RepID=UPI002B001F60|nr:MULTISPECIES: futalosine hydrolase [unclassified Paenibacillus]
MEASHYSHSSSRILIVTAVLAEYEAIRRVMSSHTADRVDLHIAGVGPATAAASTAAYLATRSDRYRLIISAGIGGGFAPHAPIGSIVLADRIIAADLGSETPEQGFISVDELGFGRSVIQANRGYTERAAAVLQASNIPIHVGAVLTVSTTTGSASTTAALLRRIPDAAAEGMEGFGVASAAQLFHIPIMELRAISNLVGPRDRDRWQIADALQSLGQATRMLTEVL